MQAASREPRSKKTPEWETSEKWKKAVDNNDEKWYINRRRSKRAKHLDKWTMYPTLKILKKIFRKRTKTKSKLGIFEASFIMTWSTKHFNMRVRSWLRMNAGGVPNTCKSNEVCWNEIRRMKAYRVADGWVTREEPALQWGTTTRNGC